MAQNFTNTLKSSSSLTGELTPKRVTGSPTANPYSLTLPQAPTGVPLYQQKTATAASTSPTVLSSVLQSKANPSAIQAPKTPAAQPSSAGTYRGVSISPGNDASIQSQIQAINSKSSPAPQVPQNQAPSPTYQAPQQQAQTPAPVTQAPAPSVKDQEKSLFLRLIERATGLSDEAKTAQEASRLFTQKKGQAINDVLHDPNKSLDTGVGRAGQIQANLGLQEQALASQAESAVQNANTAMGIAELATPQGIGQGEIKYDPTTGQMIAAGGVQVPYGNQYLNAATGQSLNPQASQEMNNAVALQVQKLRSGATDPASARTALAAYGQAGVNALEQALGGNFNPNLASANQQSATQLTQLANDLQSTFNGVDANFELLLNTALQGGVNQGDVPALNLLQQNVSRGLASNEAVINFKNTLAAVRAGYANILGGGTTTVDSQNRAQDAIPDNISVNALKSLGEQLKMEAQNRIAGINQQIKTLTNQTGGGSSSTGRVVQTAAGPINVDW